MSALIAALPGTLQQCRRALPWRRVRRPNGSDGKVPLSRRGRALYPCDPRHWLTWTAALAHVAAGEADGVGMWLDPAFGVIGLDFDQCVLPEGDLTPSVQAVLDVLADDAYVEFSPSGLGLHALVRSRLPAGWRRRPGTELISAGFLTITGTVVRRASDPWKDITPRLLDWHRTLAPPSPAASPSGRQTTADDALFLRRAFNARSAPTFRSLWEGHPDGAPSPSEGDVRMLLMLLYWGGSDITDARLDALFRSSGRFRDKWDTQHGPITYGERTLAAARTIHSKRK